MLFKGCVVSFITCAVFIVARAVGSSLLLTTIPQNNPDDTRHTRGLIATNRQCSLNEFHHRHQIRGESISFRSNPALGQLPSSFSRLLCCCCNLSRSQYGILFRNGKKESCSNICVGCSFHRKVDTLTNDPSQVGADREMTDRQIVIF